MSVTPDYMRMKLLSWNPNWNPSTVKTWRSQQLCAVYAKERARIVAQIMNTYSLK